MCGMVADDLQSVNTMRAARSSRDATRRASCSRSCSRLSDRSSSRRASLMKYLKWIVIGVVVLILIVVGVVLLRIDSIVRSTVETQATDSLDLATTLKSANVSIFGGSLALKDLEVASPQ